MGMFSNSIICELCEQSRIQKVHLQRDQPKCSRCGLPLPASKLSHAIGPFETPADLVTAIDSNAEFFLWHDEFLKKIVRNHAPEFLHQAFSQVKDLICFPNLPDYDFLSDTSAERIEAVQAADLKKYARWTVWHKLKLEAIEESLPRLPLQSIREAMQPIGFPSIFGMVDPGPDRILQGGHCQYNVEDLVSTICDPHVHKRFAVPAASSSMAPTLRRALEMEKTHQQRLIVEKGYKAKNYRVCGACGRFLFADIYGGSEDHYKVTVPNSSRRLTLCEKCGEQLKQEIDTANRSTPPAQPSSPDPL